MFRSSEVLPNVKTSERPNVSTSTGPFMAAAILALFGSIMLTTYLFHRHPDAFRALGMTELPWITMMGIRMIEFFRMYWFVAGPLFVTAAALCWKTPLGRTGWMPVAAVFFLALTLPGVAYVAMEMPIVELQRHLNKGS
jgi:hypothetical protein